MDLGEKNFDASMLDGIIFPYIAKKQYICSIIILSYGN